MKRLIRARTVLSANRAPTTLASWRSWNEWRLKHLGRRLRKEEKRLTTLEIMVDNQHLLLKSLTEERRLVESRLQEMKGISQFRTENPQLPPPQPLESILRELG